MYATQLQRTFTPTHRFRVAATATMESTVSVVGPDKSQWRCQGMASREKNRRDRDERL